jgi:hypothetical protein
MSFVGCQRLVVLALAGTACSAMDLPKQGRDTAFGVAVASNQVYIGGTLIGSLPGFTSAGKSDAFVQGYDQNGSLLWSQQFGSNKDDEVLGVAADGTGAYAGGYTLGALPGQTSDGLTDGFLAKYSPAGAPVWLHQFFASGGVTRIQAVTSDGTYVYACGYTSGSLDGQPFEGKQDVFVQKWDQSGDLLWTREIGTNELDRAYGITVNESGVFVTGRTNGTFPGQTSSGGLDAFVTMFDLNGNQVWLTQFGTSADERGWGISIDSTGLYVTGRTEGSFPGYTNQGSDDAYMAKLNFSGRLEWVNEFGTSQFDRGTASATDSTGAYSAGYTEGSLPGNTSYGSFDYYIRKFDTSGDVLWTIQFGTSSYDQIWGAVTDSTGLYVVGATGGTLPGQTAKNGFFVAKYSTAGAPLWFSETGTKAIKIP